MIASIYEEKFFEDIVVKILGTMNENFLDISMKNWEYAMNYTMNFWEIFFLPLLLSLPHINTKYQDYLPGRFLKYEETFTCIF